MTHRWQNTRKMPVDRPARIEMRVRKGYNERSRNLFDDDEENDVVCNCFPRTSDFTIPSMFYDKLQCPHTRHAHIQPAQDEHFDYPWTPNSIDGRRKPFDDDLSERVSLMSAEDEQLRFSPAPITETVVNPVVNPTINRRPEDVSNVASAPPYWYEQETDPRFNEAPRTAPADYAVPPSPLGKPRRALSMRDIRNPAYRDDAYPTTNRTCVEEPNTLNRGNRDDAFPAKSRKIYKDDDDPAANIRALSQDPAANRRVVSQAGQQNSRLSNRQFTGNYVDPKTGRVYSYNVNYDGSPMPKGTRVPVERPPRKPTSAQ